MACNINVILAEYPNRKSGFKLKTMPRPLLILIAMIAGFAIADPAHADLPLTVEDLLTAQNRWRAEISATYSNSDRNRTEVGPFAVIQTGPSQFLTFPTLVGESRRNSDILALSAGLRYGVNADTEIYSRISALAEDTRITGAAGAQTQKEQRFGDAWAGVNHRFASSYTLGGWSTAIGTGVLGGAIAASGGFWSPFYGTGITYFGGQYANNW